MGHALAVPTRVVYVPKTRIHEASVTELTEARDSAYLVAVVAANVDIPDPDIQKQWHDEAGVGINRRNRHRRHDKSERAAWA
jgi:hypothetical protein